MRIESDKFVIKSMKPTSALGNSRRKDCSVGSGLRIGSGSEKGFEELLGRRLTTGSRLEREGHEGDEKLGVQLTIKATM